ncbi:PadR family transcriptional regulator [Cryptosporangium aurantiacum]|uniref:Transcriptional regulator, PadR family n=1 Tax=Cryptosporangium aurantiacum TaxID=134849 RepID=A0A1M7R0Q4_9ACTN|nr:PadR family transcriptional regulator [Cryptosporangium aurantiacum]SHN38291.1 transcriptional regulator, PadR family [Cryptosporangium aurantiacum]
MSLRMALIGMLAANGPASGYELTKLFDSSINRVWQAKHSQIYPELAKLVETGAAVVEDAGDGRGRKIYTVTQAGRDEVVRWLSADASPRSVRNETALRAFLIPVLDPREAASIMRAEAAQHAALLRDLTALKEAIAASQGSENPAFGAYALDLGIRSARLLRDWAGDTAIDLEKRASATN